jgi:hypothetical protein
MNKVEATAAARPAYRGVARYGGAQPGTPPLLSPPYCRKPCSRGCAGEDLDPPLCRPLLTAIREREQLRWERENRDGNTEKGAVRRRTCRPARRVAARDLRVCGLHGRHLLAAPCSPCRLQADESAATPTPSRATARSAPAVPTTNLDGGVKVDLVNCLDDEAPITQP